MAGTIEEFARDRGIKCLMHFTRASNLDSILQRGLLPRDTLIEEGYNDYNDQYRYDGTHAISLSISFPNYKMFFRIREEHKDVEWVILVIYPEVLWTLPCAFCAANAASTGVTTIPLEQRRNLEALQTMYADSSDKPRSVLGIPDNYPTNPQAEVLMLNGVPRKYIYCVLVLHSSKQRELQSKHPGLDVRLRPPYFSYRCDYSHWKPGV